MTKQKELNKKIKEEKLRRSLGEHLTSIDIFNKFIWPQIKNAIYDYCWVDLYCGEGNLILPILKHIPKKRRIEFFRRHIYLFDIQKKMVDKSIANAGKYGIPRNIATENIRKQDTLSEYPKFIEKLPCHVFHITNPPYLYIGYIVKHSDDETKKALTYFKKNENRGLQDLYQIALMNDLRHNIINMIYVLPSNFLFAASGANKIRQDFFPFYNIRNAFIFEKKIFDFTGTNVCICHFEKKSRPGKETITFEAHKFNRFEHRRRYILKPDNNYRAGHEFSEFIKKYKRSNPLKINYYLMSGAVKENPGNFSVSVIDTNNYLGNEYQVVKISVNGNLYEKIICNPLFVRTVDTGTMKGRAGLFYIRNVYNAEGALVSDKPYRTNPIQVFITPSLGAREIELLVRYFNCLLEYYRDRTDGEFLTTYKYSESCPYIRKYLGLSQAKKLIETFPINELNEREKEEFSCAVYSNSGENIISFLNRLRCRANNFLEAR